MIRRTPLSRTALLLLAGALLLPLLFGCAPAATAEETVFAMDTVITLRLYGDFSVISAALAEGKQLLYALDDTLSATKDSNTLAAIRQLPAGQALTLPPEVAEVLTSALRLSDATGGAFDVTVAPLKALWSACETQDRLPTQQELAQALSSLGRDRLTLTETPQGTALTKDSDATHIDLGGIAKGYAADRLLALFQDREGITGGMITFGSSVAVFGDKPNGTPFRIALRDPRTEGGILGYVTPAPGQVLSVSGDYERYFTVGGKNYSHILDPATGYPPENGLRSVIVLCSDGATADALSTAFMIMGEEAALSCGLDFEAAFVYDDRVSTTPDWTWN